MRACSPLFQLNATELIAVCPRDVMDHWSHVVLVVVIVVVVVVEVGVVVAAAVVVVAVVAAGGCA